MCKMHCAPLMVSGIIFSLFGLVHLLRLFFGWGILVGTVAIPMWVSVIALIIAVLLAIWMFQSCCCCTECRLPKELRTSRFSYLKAWAINCHAHGVQAIIHIDNRPCDGRSEKRT